MTDRSPRDEPDDGAGAPAGIDLSTLPPPPILPPPPGPRPRPPGLSKGATRLIVGALVVSHVTAFLLAAVLGVVWWRNGPAALLGDSCDDVQEVLAEREGAPPPGPAEPLDLVPDLDLPFEWYGADERELTASQLALHAPDPDRAQQVLEQAGLERADAVVWQGRDGAELRVTRMAFGSAADAAAADGELLRETCEAADDARATADDPWYVLRSTEAYGGDDEYRLVTWVAGDERWSVSAEGGEHEVSEGLVVDVAGQVRAGAASDEG